METIRQTESQRRDQRYGRVMCERSKQMQIQEMSNGSLLAVGKATRHTDSKIIQDSETSQRTRMEEGRRERECKGYLKLREFNVHTAGL